MKIKGTFAMVIFCTFLSIYTKDIKVTSTDKLYRLLAGAPYSLVVFYDRSKSLMQDQIARQAVNDMEIMVRSLGKSPFYHDADLQILFADISRGDLMQAMERYGIATMPTFATYIGQQLIGEPLSDFAYRAQLIAFIDKNLKEQMNKRMQEKAAKRKRDLEIARIDAYNRNYWLGSPYWDSYWYGGYYPYWYGPYFW